MISVENPCTGKSRENERKKNPVPLSNTAVFILNAYHRTSVYISNTNSKGVPHG